MNFPRSIRREPGHYEDRTAWFHSSVRSHPEGGRLDAAVAAAVWAATMKEVSLDRVEVAAACLMPDHIHLLVRPQTLGLVRWLNSWKSVTTHRAWAFGHRGALWQPGMRDRTIRTTDEFEQVLEYIRQNPVVAGLWGSTVEWPFLFVDETWG